MGVCNSVVVVCSAGRGVVVSGMVTATGCSEGVVTLVVWDGISVALGTTGT